MSRAVGRSENPGGFKGIYSSPLDGEGFVLVIVLLKSGGEIVTLAPWVPTAPISSTHTSPTHTKGALIDYVAHAAAVGLLTPPLAVDAWTLY